MRIKTQTLVKTRVPTLVPVIGGGPTPEVDNLLLESGDDFLLEAGGYILLEGGSPPLVTSGLMLNYDYSNPACYTGDIFNNIFDLSGNVINGRCSGSLSSQFYYDAADYGGSFVLSPTSDPGNETGFIQTNNGMGIPPYTAAPYYATNPTFTLDFWIKPNTRNPALSGGYTIFGSSGVSTAGRITIQAIVPTTPGTAYFRVNKGAFGINTADFQSFYTFTAGSPMNVTFTKTGFVYQLYVNGQFIATVTDGTSTTYNIGGHGLGQNWNPGAPTGQKAVEKFNGSMYTFLAYNRVLTAAEIQQNFNHRRSRFGL
jgi:hypothetical protein